MGIKQPTDLSLQAISGKGADQICMHLQSYTHTRTQTCTSKNRYKHTHTRYTHHLRAHSSLRGALRPVGVGAIFVGFCGKCVCESVWVSSSANVWEGFITRQEKNTCSLCGSCLFTHLTAYWGNIQSFTNGCLRLTIFAGSLFNQKVRQEFEHLEIFGRACSLTERSKTGLTLVFCNFCLFLSIYLRETQKSAWNKKW